MVKQKIYAPAIVDRHSRFCGISAYFFLTAILMAVLTLILDFEFVRHGEKIRIG
jgi:hypothetical protein